MNGVDALALHYLAQNTVAEIADLFGEGCTGGYLYVLPTNKADLHIPIGILDQTMLAKYRMFSREKAARLNEHPRHWFSSESREPTRDRFGGAARGTAGDNSDIIISFSGMPEHIDEAMSLAYLVGMNYCTFEKAFMRIGQSPIGVIGVFPAIHDIVMTCVSGGRLMR